MKKFFIFTLILMLCFINIVPSFAFSNVSGYPAFPSEASDYYNYVIYKTSNTTYMALTRPIDLEGEYNADGLVHTNNNVLMKYSKNGALVYSAYKLYQLKDNDWYFLTENANAGNLTLGNVNDVEMISSSISFYYSDGSLFFQESPMALYQIIQKTTDKEMETLPTTLAGTMKIIVLCGVGCLALLISLPLLLKVLHSYLLR